MKEQRFVATEAACYVLLLVDCDGEAIEVRVDSAVRAINKLFGCFVAHCPKHQCAW